MLKMRHQSVGPLGVSVAGDGGGNITADDTAIV
jgi:hypothetical protein